MRGGRGGWQGQFNLLVATWDWGRGRRLNEWGRGRQDGHGTVRVSDEVDKLPLVVDAFFLWNGLLLFPLLMEMGEDEGTGSTATDHH